MSSFAEYKFKYELFIPKCCELRTFDDHLDHVLLCWGITAAMEENRDKSSCGNCEYNTEK
jgi:hypothetical protein